MYLRALFFATKKSDATRPHSSAHRLIKVTDYCRAKRATQWKGGLSFRDQMGSYTSIREGARINGALCF